MKITVAVFVVLSVSMTLSAQIARPAARPAERGSGGRADETTRIINDAERRSNGFKRTLDKALARNNVRAGAGREEQLNRNADRLERELNKVGDSWNRDHSIDKTKAHVRTSIALGNDINQAMRTWNMGGDAESEWGALRAELNRLAQTFRLPKIR